MGGLPGQLGPDTLPGRLTRGRVDRPWWLFGMSAPDTGEKADVPKSLLMLCHAQLLSPSWGLTLHIGKHRIQGSRGRL